MFSPVHCWFIFFVLRKEQEKNSFLFFPFHCGGLGWGWGLAHSGLVLQSTCVPSWGRLVRSVLAMVQGQSCWGSGCVLGLQSCNLASGSLLMSFLRLSNCDCLWDEGC